MIINETNKAFLLKGADHKFLAAYGKEKSSEFVQELRDLLDGMGEVCRLIRLIIEEIKQQNNSLAIAATNCCRDEFYERWAEVSKTHLEMCKLLGFSSLLRMDVSYMMIQLLSAESETEKIMACKHAYTIVAESRNNDLFSEIACKMRLYPESIMPKDEYSTLWRENKTLLKKKTNAKEANMIRNRIDSHKSSFVDQMNAYASIDYAQCLLDMFLLLVVTQNVDAELRKINKRIGTIIDGYAKDEKEYLVKLETLLKLFS